MSSVWCQMMGEPGPKGWSGGEGEWEAERQTLCRHLYRSVTALGRCYTLLSYIGLIDPDFRVYTRVRMVSTKLGRKRKQAVAAWLGGRHTAPQQLLLSRCTPLLFQHRAVGVWNSWSMLNLCAHPKQKKAKILQPFVHRAAALQQKHGDLWDQSNPDKWLEKLSIDLNSRY